MSDETYVKGILIWAHCKRSQRVWAGGSAAYVGYIHNTFKGKLRGEAEWSCGIDQIEF